MIEILSDSHGRQGRDNTDIQAFQTTFRQTCIYILEYILDHKHPRHNPPTHRSTHPPTHPPAHPATPRRPAPPPARSLSDNVNDSFMHDGLFFEVALTGHSLFEWIVVCVAWHPFSFFARKLFHVALWSTRTLKEVMTKMTSLQFSCCFQ